MCVAQTRQHSKRRRKPPVRHKQPLSCHSCSREQRSRSCSSPKHRPDQRRTDATEESVRDSSLPNAQSHISMKTVRKIDRCPRSCVQRQQAQTRQERIQNSRFKPTKNETTQQTRKETASRPQVTTLISLPLRQGPAQRHRRRQAARALEDTRNETNGPWPVFSVGVK